MLFGSVLILVWRIWTVYVLYMLQCVEKPQCCLKMCTNQRNFLRRPSKLWYHWGYFNFPAYLFILKPNMTHHIQISSPQILHSGIIYFWIHNVLEWFNDFMALPLSLFAKKKIIKNYLSTPRVLAYLHLVIQYNCIYIVKIFISVYTALFIQKDQEVLNNLEKLKYKLHQGMLSPSLKCRQVAGLDGAFICSNMVHPAFLCCCRLLWGVYAQNWKWCLVPCM